MSNGNITVKDIARHAGVGTSTVSRVLNGHQYVSEGSKRKVLRAIEELDYRPNLNARWLRGGKTNLVGFITDKVATTPYAVDIIGGAREAAADDNYVLVVITSNSVDETGEAIEFLLERQVTGIIYAAMFHRKIELPDNAHQVPMALANCYVEDRSLPSAVPDEFKGAYAVTRELLVAGHRRIAFLNVHDPSVDAAGGRLAGYRQALADFDVPFDPVLLGTASESSRLNYEQTQAFLRLDNAPTAFFAGNDRTAIGCYTAIRDMGLRIPHDISVVGYDNQLDIAENLLPALTTAQLPHYEMGVWAFKQLSADYDRDRPPQALIDCPLVPRESVRDRQT
ncbi:MAG: LacI family DNA-binding transcriptional regulator [Chloroflexota bacterium]